MRWRQLLAWMAVLPAAATLYFFVFWRWFEFWRRRRTLTYVMLLGSFGGVGALVAVLHRWTFAGRLHPRAGMAALGWVIVVAASAVGTVADRQIGFRVRSFTPFFEEHGRLELKTSGAYGRVRHPIYAAAIAFQLGSFLVTGYPMVAVACVVLALGAQWFTRQEEARLVALLDDPTQYERYRERVPALLPRIRRGSGWAGPARTPSR
ncbi:MAG: isoprenylcysteine carboxylmethyltransferase family protein [Actinobacteria bacterium]|nr:MAG: isoprenylcysteine carboxylmethyltransferase family protein [Actinomycetota bacterium]